MAHKVDKQVMGALWERVKESLVAPVRLFVNMGIKADKGETKKKTEYKVWMGLIEAAYKEGVAHGYTMACDVHDIPESAEVEPATAPQDGG